MAVALVDHFTSRLEEVVLIPSSGGRYEISVDGKLVYSKKETGRHIADRDATELIKKTLEGRVADAKDS